jgi:PTH1 family peptidyl-tRNA hydrolase
MPQTSQSALVIPSLIIGLGNPGSRYDRTRHNIGFVAVDALAQFWQVSLSTHKRFQAELGEKRWFNGQRVKLLKPLTYMNQSGQAIRAVVDWYNLPIRSVLVVYDDLDLPIGKIRLRLSGSAGGHNGIRSAIAHLGTQDFPRLRIGIGNPQTSTQGRQQDTISYVLGRFSSQEAQLLPEVMQLVIGAVELSLEQGIEKAMSLYNNRAISTPAP